MAPGSTCPESGNKEECHQGSSGARFYSWKVLLLRARRMFLWTGVLPFCIHGTIATNTTYFDCLSIPRVLIADLDIPNLCVQTNDQPNHIPIIEPFQSCCILCWTWKSGEILSLAIPNLCHIFFTKSIISSLYHMVCSSLPIT